MYSDEYLNELCSYIEYTLKKDLDIELLKNNLKNSYIAIRKNYTFDKFKSIQYIDNNYNIYLYEENYELCLDILRGNI